MKKNKKQSAFYDYGCATAKSDCAVCEERNEETWNVHWTLKRVENATNKHNKRKRFSFQTVFFCSFRTLRLQVETRTRRIELYGVVDTDCMRSQNVILAIWVENTKQLWLASLLCSCCRLLLLLRWWLELAYAFFHTSFSLLYFHSPGREFQYEYCNSIAFGLSWFFYIEQRRCVLQF